ncbi:MAG: hypothetical protein ABI664_20630, partial [bacterium]
ETAKQGCLPEEDIVAIVPNSLMQALSAIALVAAAASFLMTALFIHDRQRMPGLMLSAGVIGLIVAPMLHDSGVSIAIVGIANVLIVISAVLFVRILRAPSH